MVNLLPGNFGGEMGCLPRPARQNEHVVKFKNGVFDPLAQNTKSYLMH
jgi:hypothetical protein